MVDFSRERRNLLRAATGGVALASIGGITPALADRVCSAYGNNMEQCEAGIRSELASQSASAAGSQYLNQWCWAACISMVFQFHGYTVRQERIVEETWGDIVNMPAYPDQILENLNRTWTDDQGQQFMAMGDTRTANQFTAAQDLAANNPLIIGTMGHAMVLTSILYVRDSSGNGEVTGVVVRDPWPGVGRRQLSGVEWYNAIFLARIRVFKA